MFDTSNWIFIPTVGCVVVADHPITCINPCKAFIVKQVRVENGKVYVQGEHTCAFNSTLIRAATREEALEAEEFESSKEVENA